MKPCIVFCEFFLDNFQFSLMFFLVSSILVGCVSTGNTGEEGSNYMGDESSLANNTHERDNRLVGIWEKVSYSRTGVHNEKRMALYGDGTSAIFTRTYAVTTDGGASFSFDDGWVKNENVQAFINRGGRWVTRNGALVSISPEGNESIDFYYEIEVWNGKTNLFTMNSPSQKKPTEMFQKIQ